MLSNIEPVDGESSLNFNVDEFRKWLTIVETLERTVNALQLKNHALKSQLNSVNTKVKGNTVLLDKQEQYMRRDRVETKGILVSHDEGTSHMEVNVHSSLSKEGPLYPLRLKNNSIMYSRDLRRNRTCIKNRFTSI